MQFDTLGKAEIIQRQADTLTIQAGVATVRVSVYSPAIIRVQVTKEPDAEDYSFAVIQQPEGGLEYVESDESIEVTTATLKLVIDKDPLRFNFYTADSKELSRDDERFGINWQGDRVVNYRKLYPDERFIGLGEKTGDLDRRGCNYVNWNSDVPFYTEKSDPLYQTFPFFIGIHSGATYGLFFDNTHRSFFDFGATTDHRMSWFGADGGDLNYYFFGAQSVAEIIKDYTWLTGRMEMPPLWSLGYQQCRWSYMSAKEVLDIAKTFRDHNIPADVMYCDIDYMDGFKIFTWNNETFPDPKSFIDKLKEMGFRLVTIVDPGIKIEEGYKQYDEGVAKDYFAKYPNGENFVGEVWPGRCYFPDFFRKDVRDWWGASFDALIDPGVEGFWNDMNEPAAWGQNLPWMVKFGDKFLPEVRNVYGMEMARATYEGTKKILGNKRPFVLTRAAYSGTQRYSAVWTGDNSAYDEHMLLGQRLVNSLGLSGMSFTGVDIGGFSLNPTPELMVRWNSLGVYTPMYRNHAQQGTVMREPWEWGADNEAIIKKDIELRYQLLPYIYSAYYQSAQTGLPVARSLAIDHAFDATIYKSDFQNQFMFGDSLLVAPVASESLQAKVYLPDGNWYRFGFDERYSAGEHVVEAPLNNLPVFAKAGAILPMQNVVQNTNEKGDGVLLIHIWNGDEPTTFTYYEDDGLTYDNEQGIYYKRDITFEPASKQITFSEVEGSFVSRFDRIQLVLHGFEGVEHTATLDNIKEQIVINL